MTIWRTGWLLSLAFLCGGSGAADIGVGSVERIPTRDGVVVPVYSYWRSDAVATVALFSGGAGGYGQIGEDGWPAGGNFLIRTGKRWAGYPFNVVMVGRPTDGLDLSLGSIRSGEKHASDNQAIFRAIKNRNPVPLWVVGTSMGTISATAAAIQDSEKLIAGVVLTSSIVAYKVPGAVPKQNLENIRVPTLIFHHANDGCWACAPHEVKNLARALKNSPVRKIIFADGGDGASGDPCEPMHRHGFVGMRDEAVDLVASWILNPTE